MKNLINFFIQYAIVFLFVLLEIISLWMIVENQEYQKSIYLSSSNKVVSSIYEWNNNVIEFFKLRAANDNLSEENTALKNQIIKLQNELYSLKPDSVDSIRFRIPPEMEYEFISAKVISNTTTKVQNYITINKGSDDGIRQDMGVVSDEGVVGVVKTVSPRFAVIIPILNPKIEVSCKFRRTNYSGTLQWTLQDDYRTATLNDIARHVEVAMGDTLITNGYVKSFPEGVPVGYVDDFHISEGDAYYFIRVKLAVDFRTLSHVKVINYLNYEQQNTLEKVSQE